MRPTKRTGRRERRQRIETKKSERGCYCIEETDGGDVLLLLEEEREGIDGARILCSMVASHVGPFGLYI